MIAKERGSPTLQKAKQDSRGGGWNRAGLAPKSLLLLQFDCARWQPSLISREEWFNDYLTRPSCTLGALISSSDLSSPCAQPPWTGWNRWPLRGLSTSRLPLELRSALSSPGWTSGPQSSATPLRPRWFSGTRKSDNRSKPTTNAPGVILFCEFDHSLEYFVQDLNLKADYFTAHKTAKRALRTWVKSISIFYP